MLKDLLKAFTSIKELKNFILKYEHLIAYLFFGVLTTLINLISFWTLSRFTVVETIPATIIAWIIAVIFAFVTNKIWVFKSKNKSRKETTKEIINFLIARIITLFVEVFIMWLMVDHLHHDKLIWKLLCNVITVVLNYLFSKLFVFKGSHHQKIK